MIGRRKEAENGEDFPDKENRTNLRDKHGHGVHTHGSVSLSQFSRVAQSYLTLCKPMDCTMPGSPVLHQLPELAQTRVHPTISFSVVPFSSCLQSFPASGSPPMCQFFRSDGQILEFQLKHQSFQRIFRIDFL